MPTNDPKLHSVLSTLSGRIEDIAKRQEKDAERQQEDSKAIRLQLADSAKAQVVIESKVNNVESVLMLHKAELEAKLQNALNSAEIQRLNQQLIDERGQQQTQTRNEITFAGMGVKQSLLWALLVAGLIAGVTYLVTKAFGKG